MRIGVCVSFNGIAGFGGKLDKLKAEGFDNCQLVCWNPEVWTDEGCSVVKNETAANGIEISAFWCGWEGPMVWDFYDGPKTLGLLPKEYREIRIKNLCDGAGFAKRLGIKNVVTHIGFIPENPNDPEFLPFCEAVKRVALHLKENEQNLLFETGQETPVAMLRCMEEIGTDNLGVNLDTANLILYGKANPVDSLDVFGDRVMNLHAKDGLYPTNGKALGKEVPIGEGKVDFEALFKKLKAIGYDGFVTIEREIKGEKQLEDIRNAKKYLENIITRVYG
ncbi:MAG: sugar phosphate isomerase/epimerase [Ruminococcaceae bacterium]|nr:sugar phosphate isomerase/epimerase [Oscillospiraceae bacterium]